jgi:hypothetical protein
MMTSSDVAAFLRDYEFLIERASTATEAEDLSREIIASVTPRLARTPTLQGFYHAHLARVLNRRLEKLNAKAEADAGAERTKASTASKRG